MAEKRDIVNILHESARQLGELKKQVQDLETFFKGILNDVDVTVRKDVAKGFLRPLENGMRMNRARVVTEIVMDEEDRKVRYSL